MKKFGFTLAEILITMSVIGVVAALTVPALNSAIQKNKVAPHLKRFINTIENANDRMFADNDADTISDITTVHADYSQEEALQYLNHLKNYVKGKTSVPSENLKFTYYDGTTGTLGKSQYAMLTLESGEEMAFRVYRWLYPNAPYKGRTGYIYYDINGFGKEPDKLCKDIFVFSLDENGTLLPNAGKAYLDAYKNVQRYQSNERQGLYCSGDIADNNWEVKYKY